MRALVCDCCGKVSIVSDNPFPNVNAETGYHTMYQDAAEGGRLDLCEKCFKTLTKAVRETRGGDSE
jgi:hypothetical protein